MTHNELELIHRAALETCEKWDDAAIRHRRSAESIKARGKDDAADIFRLAAKLELRAADVRAALRSLSCVLSLQTYVEHWRGRAERAEADCAALREERAALLKDKERMDWLEARPPQYYSSWTRKSLDAYRAEKEGHNNAVSDGAPSGKADHA